MTNNSPESAKAIAPINTGDVNLLRTKLSAAMEQDIVPMKQVSVAVSEGYQGDGTGLSVRLDIDRYTDFDGDHVIRLEALEKDEYKPGMLEGSNWELYVTNSVNRNGQVDVIESVPLPSSGMQGQEQIDTIYAASESPTMQRYDGTMGILGLVETAIAAGQSR